jgi:hypothetical protein
MRALNLICAVEGSAYFSRCPQDSVFITLKKRASAPISPKIGSLAV